MCLHASCKSALSTLHDAAAQPFTRVQSSVGKFEQRTPPWSVEIDFTNLSTSLLTLEWSLDSPFKLSLETSSTPVIELLSLPKWKLVASGWFCTTNSSLQLRGTERNCIRGFVRERLRTLSPGISSWIDQL